MEIDSFEIRNRLAKLREVVEDDLTATSRNRFLSQSNPLEKANKLTLDIVDREAHFGVCLDYSPPCVLGFPCRCLNDGGFYAKPCGIPSGHYVSRFGFPCHKVE